MTQMTKPLMKSPIKPPAAAQWLGYAGLLPFAGLALCAYFGGGEMAALARQGLYLYGAIILSFLGGLHWGRLSTPGQDFSAGWLIWSVLPSLWGWALIWWQPGAPATGLGLAAALLICWAVDRYAIKAGLFVPWLAVLRRHLSLGASLSLLLGSF